MSDSRFDVPRRALCPGSFDPVTNGHLDIINRAAALYDELTVAVFVNRTKTSMFSADERREMLTEALADQPNVTVDVFQGLVVDYCRDHQVPVIVKLAERRLMLSEVMRLGTGAIIEFFKSSDEPLELLINNKVIGVGETVKVGENFGLRITQIGDLKQVIKSLGETQR